MYPCDAAAKTPSRPLTDQNLCEFVLSNGERVEVIAVLDANSRRCRYVPEKQIWLLLRSKLREGFVISSSSPFV